MLTILSTILLSNHSYADKDDTLYLGFIVALWPIFAIVGSFVICFELYKYELSQKTKMTLDLIKKDPTSISSISVKELKLILFANKLNAIRIDDKLISKVKSSLIDRSFEETLLKIRDK